VRPRIAPYDGHAQWYDETVREFYIPSHVVLPWNLALATDKYAPHHR
jgi:hypothetical protein